MKYTGYMKERRNSWLVEMWKIKAEGWRENARVYAKSFTAFLRSLIFPARELRKLDGRLSGRGRLREDQVLARAGKWFAVLERVGLRPSCLVRSLTLASVLREEGHDAHLVFGVRGDNGDMEGHCWVAVGDETVTEAPTSYQELEWE